MIINIIHSILGAVGVLKDGCTDIRESFLVGLYKRLKTDE